MKLRGTLTLYEDEQRKKKTTQKIHKFQRIKVYRRKEKLLSWTTKQKFGGLCVFRKQVETEMLDKNRK